MNCSHCNSPSAEGKKYCADCGAPLDSQQPTFIDAVIAPRINEVIRTRFRDQNLVEIETSQAIVERVQGWAKLFLFFAGIPFALLLGVLGFAGIEKYSDFRNLITSVEKQVQPQIERAKADAEQAEQTAKQAQLEAAASRQTIQQTVAEAKKQMGSAAQLADNVKSLSARVSELDQQTSSEIKVSSQKVEARVADLDQKIDDATKDIAEQQKKLANTDELVTALFSKGTTEYFPTAANAPNTVIVPLSPNAAIVFLLLKEAPIYQTVDLKWHVYSQPKASFQIQKNLMIFSWGEPADNLKPHPLEVTYVPNPTSKEASYKALSVKNSAVFADDTQIMQIPALHPPK